MLEKLASGGLWTCWMNSGQKLQSPSTTFQLRNIQKLKDRIFFMRRNPSSPSLVSVQSAGSVQEQLLARTHRDFCPKKVFCGMEIVLTLIFHTRSNLGIIP